MDAEQQAFLRALRADYLGEIVGEVDHQVQALIAQWTKACVEGRA